MYSRSFKPQLEDIKSSYMLLNKQNQDQNNKGNMDKGNFYFLTKCVFTFMPFVSVFQSRIDF